MRKEIGRFICEVVVSLAFVFALVFGVFIKIAKYVSKKDKFSKWYDERVLTPMFNYIFDEEDEQ